MHGGGGAIVLLPLALALPPRKAAAAAAAVAECRGGRLSKSREIVCGTAIGHALLERPWVDTPQPRASSSLRATEDWLKRPTTQKAVPRTEKFGALIASSVSICSTLSSSAGAAPLPLPLPLPLSPGADEEAPAADAAEAPADGVSIAALICRRP